MYCLPNAKFVIRTFKRLLLNLLPDSARLKFYFLFLFDMPIQKFQTCENSDEKDDIYELTTKMHLCSDQDLKLRMP